MSRQQGVTILGIFVVDLAFRAGRLPVMGETILGDGFKMGPGGKGSNQAVAAARAGAGVTFLTRVGADEFGSLGRRTWEAEGIDTSRLITSEREPTGAAFIFVSSESGDNAIIVEPGAAAELSAADVEAAADAIRHAAVFVTQLEQPVATASRALGIARAAGVVTVLNPAPAAHLPDAIFALCDYVTPNETEAAALTGITVASVDDARRAADVLLAKGAGATVLTLGERGALFHDRERSVLVPAFAAGPVVETTGAGDAFNGAFAAALAEGMDPVSAVRFGCAAAGISVTRPGTAPSMPTRAEIEALLERGPGR
ncbi:ribokinase [Benzoatithermus flavus]|uniref:Ribokinase n=1 Tax=Benzoatithermus flavus TaxID=3108223 RepID=A0ABU8XYA8_9PROT